MIDLHVHSTFSDGTMTPSELVTEAAKWGLSAVALTDHDTTEGIPAFLAACEGSTVEGIPGVEISCDVEHGTMHMLGYFISAENEELGAALAKIREGRSDRNGQILAKLNELGLGIAREDVEKHAVDGVVGRPHFAKALLDAGKVSSVKDAFNRYLGKGGLAYMDRFRFPPGEGIAAIRASGGVAVLAHPYSLGLNLSELRELISDLSTRGLGGIETYYSEHGSQQIRDYGELAKEFNLVTTGGSDFHGELTPDLMIGRGFGPLRVPDEVVDSLRAASGRDSQ